MDRTCEHLKQFRASIAELFSTSIAPQQYKNVKGAIYPLNFNIFRYVHDITNPTKDLCSWIIYLNFHLWILEFTRAIIVYLVLEEVFKHVKGLFDLHVDHYINWLDTLGLMWLNNYYIKCVLKMVYLIGPNRLVNRRFAHFHNMVWKKQFTSMLFFGNLHTLSLQGMQNISGFVTKSIFSWEYFSNVSI